MEAAKEHDRYQLKTLGTRDEGLKSIAFRVQKTLKTYHAMTPILEAMPSKMASGFPPLPEKPLMRALINWRIDFESWLLTLPLDWMNKVIIATK